MWKPGRICVVLDAYQLLKPGDFWDRETIVSSVLLQVNNTVARTLLVSDLLGGFVLLEDGVEVAGTGGPYQICGDAPILPGYVRVLFQFKNYSYSWWYRNVKGLF